MSVYFFDVETEYGSFADDRGQTFGDREAARCAAIALLAPIAGKAPLITDGPAIKVTVRDENRRAILFATLSLDTCWIA